MRKIVIRSVIALILGCNTPIFTQNDSSYTCTTAADGSSHCVPGFKALTKALLADKTTVWTDGSKILQELNELLNSASQSYNPELALSLSMDLIAKFEGEKFYSTTDDWVSSLGFNPTFNYFQTNKSKWMPRILALQRAKPFLGNLLSFVLNILVRGLHRPGHEGGKRTVQELQEDLLALALLAHKFDFKEFISNAKPDAKTDAGRREALSQVVTSDDFKLDDIYKVYDRSFNSDKQHILKNSIPKPKHFACTPSEEDLARYLDNQSFFVRGTLFSKFIGDLLSIAHKYKLDLNYKLGKFYEDLLEREKKGTMPDLTPGSFEEEVRLAFLFDLWDLKPDQNFDVLQSCVYAVARDPKSTNLNLILYLIDNQDKIAEAMKITPIKKQATSPLTYVTLEDIQATLNYNARKFKPSTLCRRMGACIIDEEDEVTNVYKGQPNPDPLIMAIVNEFLAKKK